MTTGEDPEETGRLLVTLYAADNHGQCFPIECIVPVTIKDDDGSDIEMASVFGDCFEVGQTLSCEFNRVVRHIGGNGKKKKAFGKSADIAVSNGYDIEELILVGADTIDEPAELTREDANGNEVPVETDWINPEAMKKAVKARKAMLEEKVKEKKEGKPKTSGRSSLQEAKSAKKSVGKKTAVVEDFDDDDDFTTEEDPF